MDVRATPDVAIVATGVGRRYGGRWAIRDVTLGVPRGSIAALVGPNGAGKSTLIRACLGFERLDAGRLLVNGIDVARERTKAVLATGYVPQGSALFRDYSIADHLDLARSLRPGYDVGYARILIDSFHLSPKRGVSTLSGGERAKVALALALGTTAPVLLLDEPLADLDPLSRQEFLAILTDDARERGMTALLASHVVADVEQACDRLIVITAGCVALDAPVAEILATYRVTPDRSVIDGPAVGHFPTRAGEDLILFRGTAAGRPASLEDVVLCYLAAGRYGEPRAA
ncbi:MAG: ABC transporter ATP-binding protein [Candidatus Limnocylindrales bacterium]